MKAMPEQQREESRRATPTSLVSQTNQPANSIMLHSSLMNEADEAGSLSPAVKIPEDIVGIMKHEMKLAGSDEKSPAGD